MTTLLADSPFATDLDKHAKPLSVSVISSQTNAAAAGELKRQIEQLLASFITPHTGAQQNTGNNEHPDEVADNYVFPSFQLPGAGLFESSTLLQRLLGLYQQHRQTQQMELNIASGYMNFTEEFLAALLSSGRGTGPVKLIAASPAANGWFDGSGLSRYIPDLYAVMGWRTLRQAQAAGARAVELWEFARRGWSFHCKRTHTLKGLTMKKYSYANY